MLCMVVLYGGFQQTTETLCDGMGRGEEGLRSQLKSKGGGEGKGPPAGLNRLSNCRLFSLDASFSSWLLRPPSLSIGANEK